MPSEKSCKDSITDQDSVLVLSFQWFSCVTEKCVQLSGHHKTFVPLFQATGACPRNFTTLGTNVVILYCLAIAVRRKCQSITSEKYTLTIQN